MLLEMPFDKLTEALQREKTKESLQKDLDQLKTMKENFQVADTIHVSNRIYFMLSLRTCTVAVLTQYRRLHFFLSSNALSLLPCGTLAFVFFDGDVHVIARLA
jgi:hypothetical protein